MSNILKIVKERRSSRVQFDQKRSLTKKDLDKIIEVARWAPTAHNMQNFEIIIVDDKELLEKIGNIKYRVSEDFIRENYQQLSFSKEELLQKKVGILGTMFPPSWRDPSKLGDAARESTPRPLNQSINGSPVLLVVIYDSRKRAPASKGDALGFMSLGCVIGNMWLMAQSLGIGLQILSGFSAEPGAREIKLILNIPEHMEIAFAVRLGYPVSKPAEYLRVRRDMEAFVHNNKYGNKTSTHHPTV
jgi:nitroreductase